MLGKIVKGTPRCIFKVRLAASDPIGGVRLAAINNHRNINLFVCLFVSNVNFLPVKACLMVSQPNYSFLDPFKVNQHSGEMVNPPQVTNNFLIEIRRGDKDGSKSKRPKSKWPHAKTAPDWSKRPHFGQNGPVYWSKRSQVKTAPNWSNRPLAKTAPNWSKRPQSQNGPMFRGRNGPK